MRDRIQPLDARVEPGKPVTSLVLEAPDRSSTRHLRVVFWLARLTAVASLGGLVWFPWREKPGSS